MARRAMVNHDPWSAKYRDRGRIWGDEPSELGVLAARTLQANHAGRETHVLDVGCGYGRDAAYLARTLSCRVLGIDRSPEAIRLAREAWGQADRIAFCCCDFGDMDGGAYDALLVSNLYHLLERDERTRLCRAAVEQLGPGGLLFLGALSTSDRQDYGKGERVPGEPHSFRGKGYRHFATREELEAGFASLAIRELYEHTYDEPHPGSETHHHVAWILIGERE